MMLMKWVRHINGLKSDHKIVCTTKGSEALFPSANEFYYDWEPVADAMKNCRLLRSRDNHKYLSGLREQFKQTYPNAEFIYPSMELPNEKEWGFIPEPKIKRGLLVDIVVGPRFRQYGEGRNFMYWQEVISKLAANGYTIGAIGAENTSVPNLVDVVHKSWDYDFLDSGLEMLRNCRLALMSCSGPAHLAVLCGTPLKVIYDKPNRAVDGRGKWYMHIMQSVAVAYAEPILYGWNNPQKVVDETLLYLKETKAQ
jgi:hypothetical protein